MRNFTKPIWLLPIIAFGVLFGAAVNAETVTANEVAKLLAGDPAGLDNFGYSVAVDGDTALIGAYKDDDNGSNSGSVYVFIRDSTGMWREHQKLIASEATPRGLFGASVALDGDTALIGAYKDYGWAGAAYVFTRNSTGVWSEHQRLLASGTYQENYRDEFGYSVALDGDTAVIGAAQDNADGGPTVRMGSAYVFTRDSAGLWSEQKKLLASDRLSGDRYDYFGSSVALDGDTVVIGAPADDTGLTGDSIGAVYVYTRDSEGVWTEHEQQRLTASNPMVGAALGISVGVAGNTIVSGAQGVWVGSDLTGAAYVFTRDSAGIWSEQQQLTASDSGPLVRLFGRSLAMEGGTVVIGAPQSHVSLYHQQSGAAYLFTRSAGIWTEQVKLLASDSLPNDRLGGYLGPGVGVSGSTVLAGAPGRERDTLGLTDAGAAYVFSFVTNTPPVAEAGPSQDIKLGDTVQLDGSGSYDEETASEDLLYAWQFEEVPLGSQAALGDANTMYPTFTADVFGNYVINLTVTDESDSSALDKVIVSTLNTPPNADAGEDQGVLVGTIVNLDGAGSSDPDEDILSYAWTIQGNPTFDLIDADTVSPWFQPDMAGVYDIELIVNDGYVDSDPDIVTVLVSGLNDYVCERMSESVNLTANMPVSSFTTKGNKKALSNFLRLGCENTQIEEFDEAQHKLEQALSRTDGCIVRGKPDQAGGEPGIKKDFVIDCSDQAVIYPLILEALESLTPSLP